MRWKICGRCTGYGRRFHVDSDGRFSLVHCAFCGGCGEIRQLGRSETRRIEGWAHRVGFSFPQVVFDKIRGTVLRGGVTLRADACSGSFVAKDQSAMHATHIRG